MGAISPMGAISRMITVVQSPFLKVLYSNPCQIHTELLWTLPTKLERLGFAAPTAVPGISYCSPFSQQGRYWPSMTAAGSGTREYSMSALGDHALILLRVVIAYLERDTRAVCN